MQIQLIEYFDHSEWTQEEDAILTEKYKLIGPKWVQMRQFFPHRTANSIKNRYNYTILKKQDQFVKENQIPKKDQIVKNDEIDENLINESLDFDQQVFNEYDDIRDNDLFSVFMNE